MMMARSILIAICYLAGSAITYADDNPAYTPGKVVYDLTSADPKTLEHVFDRASLLQNMYGHDIFNASIVIVVHEQAIPFFASKNSHNNSELIQRASSLVLGEIIEFRLCRISAKLQGYEADDFPEFVKVIPMADAEMIQLQHAGYAYLN